MSDSYRIFIRDLVLAMEIGIHPHEKGRKQRVRINLVAETLRDPDEEGIHGVVSYEDLLDGVKEIAGRGHIDLVEIFADRIIDMVLEYRRVLDVNVRIEKLDVFGDAESVGVEMSRARVV
ncbi:MAG: dihydroneopterin aldolase [Minwuia sp.]|uniref:dihydroneopterin aldolase n=1 Tax=Minwuia sp. TaxID=2493630 RepID=UPI003A87511B